MTDEPEVQPVQPTEPTAPKASSILDAPEELPTSALAMPADGNRYVYKQAVKDLAKSEGLRMSAKALEDVNMVVENLLKAAFKRCKGNNRVTVSPADL